MKFLLTLFLAILIVSSKAQSDSTMLHYAETINRLDLKTHLSVLASDAYEGRKTGEKGQKMAADYLVNYFKSNGLIGPVKQNTDNNYLQPFEIVKRNWSKCTLKTKGKTLRAFEQFFPYQYFEISEEEREVIFVGYGIETDDYSDYKGVEVTNKIVMFLKGTPPHLTEQLTEGEKKETNKVRRAWEKGAALVIVVNESEQKFQNQKALVKKSLDRPFRNFIESKQKSKQGLIFIASRFAPALLQLSPKRYKEMIAKLVKTEKPQHHIAEYKAKLLMDINTGVISTENVLAYVEGTDKKDEVLVISAHYDHLGIKNNQVYNGADDDGSGTVALMEIAQAFSQAAAAGHRPRRSILFIAFTGEEIGLYGSDYYTSNPIFMLHKTSANLNMDMIGRITPKYQNRDYIYTIGSNMLSDDLHRLHVTTVSRLFPQLKIDYHYNDKKHPERHYYRSDHYNFAKYTIPVIFYFSGPHPDYHQPSDTIEKIDFQKIEQTARLVFCTAWQIINQEEELNLNKK